MMPLLEVRASYLEASMQAIEGAYGDMARYLSDGLEVDVEGLRRYYLA
jgi:protein-tyrosine phosphatase